MKPIAFLIPILLAAPGFAQSAPSGSNASAVDAARTVWAGVSGYITQAAQDVPDSDYAFRPTPEVRSFGQLIGHLAGAQMLICAAALGEKGGSEDDTEKTKTTKADLIAALQASNAYCGRAYAQSDADVAGMTKLFGQDRTRLFALLQNATHDSEHYGNIVTYMRLKGMVPPSSRRQ